MCILHIHARRAYLEHYQTLPEDTTQSPVASPAEGQSESESGKNADTYLMISTSAKFYAIVISLLHSRPAFNSRPTT